MNLTSMLPSFREAARRYAWCAICHQPPWRVVGWESFDVYGYRMMAWCHGAVRSWVISYLALELPDRRWLNKALEAFPPMPKALPPILVTIRRTRGRRMPAPPPGQLRVWLVPSSM